MESSDHTSGEELFISQQKAIQAMASSMDEKTKRAYQKIGEQLYGQIDFETCENLNVPAFMADSAQEIGRALSSGLLPKDLDSDELSLLKEVYGPEWFKRWNYTLDDLKKDSE